MNCSCVHLFNFYRPFERKSEPFFNPIKASIRGQRGGLCGFECSTVFGREKNCWPSVISSSWSNSISWVLKTTVQRKEAIQWKSLSDGQGQRMARLVQIDRKGHISHLLQPENREGGYLWMQRTLKLMDRSSRRPRPLIHLTAETVKQRLGLAEDWTMLPDLRIPDWRLQWRCEKNLE